MGREQRWFEVTTRVKIQAPDEDDAISRLAGRLKGDDKIEGLYPVGTFNAVECPDPIAEARRRVGD